MNGLNGTASPLAVSANNANTTQQLYQLLLAQKLQQNQALHISPVSEPAVSSQPSPNDLVQQLAQTLLVNPSISTVSPQTSIVSSPTQPNYGQDLSQLQSLLPSQPNLLASVLNAQNQARQALQPNLIALLQQQQAQRVVQQPNQAAILQLMQTNPLLASQIIAQQQNVDSNATLNLLTHLSQQQQQEQESPPIITSETLAKPQPSYDEILKRQQESQQNIAAAIAAVQHKQPRLTSQSSSSSLFSNPCNDPPNTSTPTSDISTPKPAPPAPAQRQASSDRLLSGAESVQDHISRLISENEAIVEPNPVLLKRRPYHRQSTSNSITSQTSEAVGPSQRESPGLFHNVPNHRLPTTRSQSMHESQMLQHVHRMNNNGSLTSGQPLRGGQPSTATNTTSSCNFCNLKFPNEAGLKAHEFRCSKKEQLQKRLLLQKQKSQPQLWHNNALLNAQQQQLFLLQQQQLQQQQQKLMAQQQHQSTIAALVGGGAGVAPELFANNMFGGRNSVPMSSSPGPSRATTSGAPTFGSPAMTSSFATTSAPSPPLGSKNGTSSPSTSSTCSENRHPLKKRLLESVARHSSDMDLNHRSPGTPTSACSSMDTSEAQQSPAKMAKLDTDLLNLLQQNVNKSAEQVLNQLLNTPQSTNSTTVVPDSILYANSYIQAKISLKMPYPVTLNTIRGERTDDVPWMVTQQRNVTYMKKTIDRIYFSLDEMTNGQSNYDLQHFQPILSPEEEKHLLQVLRHSPNQPKLLHYSQSQAVTYRTTHSSYWKAYEAKAVTNTTSAMPAPISTPQEMTKPEPSKTAELIVDKHETPSPVDHITQSDLKIEDGESPTRTLEKIEKMELKPIGKQRPEEVEVYVRGRGRGRYVCERCGIRCKKPSMLKKHLKSHTNIRPFSCITCNFAFKTKGNLTKHLFSKTHRVKVGNVRGDVQPHNEEENALKVYTTEGEAADALKLSELESRFVNDEFDNKNDDNDSDNEDEIIGFSAPLPPCSAAIPYRRFGQENILFERTAHTPPTLWTLYPNDDPTQWPKADDPERSCHSAPPACSSTLPKKSDKKSLPSLDKKSLPGLEKISSMSALDKISVLDTEPSTSSEFNFNNFQLNRPIEMEDAERSLAAKNATANLMGNSRGLNLLGERLKHLGNEDLSLVSGLRNSTIPVLGGDAKMAGFDQDQLKSAAFLGQDQHNKLVNLGLDQHKGLMSLGQDQHQKVAFLNQDQRNTISSLIGLNSFGNSIPSLLEQLTGASVPSVLKDSGASYLKDSGASLLNNSGASLLKDSGIPISALLKDSALSLQLQNNLASLNGINDEILKKAVFASLSDQNLLSTASGDAKFHGFVSTDSKQLVPSSYDPKIFGSTPSEAKIFGTPLSEAKILGLSNSEANVLASSSSEAKNFFDLSVKETLAISSATSKLANLAELSSRAGSVLFPLDNLKQISNTSVGEFLATECRPFYCDICERKFRKESELNLHKQTHLIEQQNARTRAYQCSECRTVHRSKALLIKHMEQAHNKALETDDKDDIALANTDAPETSTNVNMRRYYCSDCDVGFRTHGVLIKHLRSKNHVKTLAAQGKIPEDALSLIKDHTNQLAQIDASDCVQAKKTIIQLLEELRSEQKSDTPSLAIGISEQSLSLLQHAETSKKSSESKSSVFPILHQPES
ncbi:unnamed protein product [Bursaphelenchus okinawaensis]|uniref:C2H2-type domain-containing protein n=1 Tax=Bursaphelenchus okinawaensis TaxID=465554 RepID=A0A811LSQ5_9BILA|nr:unnamed protein product [Bursaphelenchus okinawaensis]CAG9127740.1 unnamed protein product [Bursaphelenchus okinawaensis]